MTIKPCGILPQGFSQKLDFSPPLGYNNGNKIRDREGEPYAQHCRSDRPDPSRVGGIHPTDRSTAAQPAGAGEGDLHCRKPQGHRPCPGRRLRARVPAHGAPSHCRGRSEHPRPVRRCAGVHGGTGGAGSAHRLRPDPWGALCHAASQAARRGDAVRRRPSGGGSGGDRGSHQRGRYLPLRRRPSYGCRPSHPHLLRPPLSTGGTGEHGDDLPGALDAHRGKSGGLAPSRAGTSRRRPWR